MAKNNDELEELKRQVASLTARVFRLEQASGTAVPEPIQETLKASEPARAIPPRPSPPSAPHGLREHSGFGAFLGAGASPKKDTQTLESQIGSQWLNRIGIIALLIGASYFLKYAFENDWIGPGGRVAIGLAAGIGLVAWSEWFRNRAYRVFSYSLKAVGIGTIYLSLWAAFQLYHLLPSAVAFLAMVIVMAATAVMAVTQNAQVLAAFALIGGFATPVLLSSGQNREVELFTYLALLDVATLALMFFRPWTRLIIGNFAGTLVLYIGWYSRFYTDSQLLRTAGFATLFFAIFATAPLLIREKTITARGEVVPPVLTVLVLANAVAYFFQLFAMLNDEHQTALAWISVALAAVYLVLARILRGRQPSRGLTLLNVALAVGFLTIAIPLKMETHWITIGWLIEAAVLLWVADRIESTFLEALSVGALILGIVRLVFVERFQSTTIFFNPRFATYLIAIGVLAGVIVYGKRKGKEAGIPTAVIVLNLLALIALTGEVSGYFQRQMMALATQPRREGSGVDYHTLSIARDFGFSAVWMLYGGGLMTAGFWRRSAFLRWQALLLIAATVAKVFIYDVSSLDRGYRILSFIALGVLLLAISFAYQKDWLKLSAKPAESKEPA